ncbi:sialin [Oncorhynchus tshawytscha]|uniref:Sialin n=1 Tax=Oncorhynchus tshawytscha TaxID=74940 RepID=A0A8C8CZQ3_ONCTS|nr:sialin [Oncorhynchus tshawytscha]XP_024297522.1 sialin [Oncorhynchus tshawytscha]XP_024297523.1 sialin [Oncorhynchus tshawytscha]XP_024297525.1 sialin [Oncorhynchus tshawytscha]XP_024297526.1 sialin [Oncorhynchus tshawytscha]
MALQNGYSINSTPLDESGETTPLLKKQVVDVDDSVPPQCCSARYNLAIMMFFGFSVVYGLRVNLSVAMVAMVNGTNSQPTLNSSVGHECPVSSHGNNNGSQTPDQPDGIPQYSWDSPTQGLLLGAFFFGYLVTQIPGGYLAGHFGGSIFLGGGVLGTAALTLLTPLAAQLGPYWLFGLRALEGFGEGVTFPAMMAMWARWAPPLERSRLISLSGSGANFGAFVALPLTGFICHSLGWPAVFYMCGGAGCIWAVFWFILVSDQPGTHPRISTREKHYIINSIGKDGGAHGWSVPLLPMVLSVPLWAIIVSQMCANWGYYTLLTSLPTYMDTVLHFDLRQNAFLSALPYLGGWAFSVISGVVADSLLEKELLSVTAVRKIFTITGLLLPAAFLVAVGFSGCSGVLAVTFLTLSTTVGGTSAAGVFINQIDIAPRYAGVLLGITNTFATIPGVVAPIITGYLTKDHSLAGWRNVFCLSAGISAGGALVFTLFGSGKVQKWALAEEDQEQAETERDGLIPT